LWWWLCGCGCGFVVVVLVEPLHRTVVRAEGGAGCGGWLCGFVVLVEPLHRTVVCAETRHHDDVLFFIALYMIVK
jgi:hypothetical protein